ncbi:unnamed protein product [Candidula unifasciata]|uniref:Uncharacterized protein n=1 Tax=Candidula unifasciata TaxID=100452 RepID=A0A8S3ZV28_9EUPU|nr:unnamed protein product [Candidula unifasciata]
MAHSHVPESGNPHTHEHSNNCEEELSAKYAEYVEAHLEQLRAQCQKISICVDDLLADENIIAIINGYDLSIKKTCSLVYKSTSQTFSNFSKECTSKDRESIHAEFEDHLTYQIENDKPVWKNVTKCLEKNYGISETPTYVDQICGLAYNKTQICNASTHKTIRDFFNDQIHHLKCTCKALQTSQLSMPLLVGSAAGVILLLFLLFVIGFFCYRHKKSRKRQKQAPNVIYLQAPNADNNPVYQEIMDDKPHQGYKQPSSLNPPSLPVRYTTPVVNPPVTQFGVHEDAHGYLEPVAASSRFRPTLPLPGQSNTGYEVPPDYTQDDDDGVKKAIIDGSCLEPVDDEDKGYDTLGRNKTGVEASKAEMVPLGPVPAKRTKKDDRQTESHYFELETNGNNF